MWGYTPQCFGTSGKENKYTESFKQIYNKRAGVEGSISQATGRYQLRYCRYIGLAKTLLQHVITAAAINLSRMWDWWQDVRRNLEKNKEKLTGLYVGNPKRKTARPTAEIILAAFKEITLLLIEVKNEVYAHLTALSPLQERILVLLGFSTTIYTQLGGQSFTPE